MVLQRVIQLMLMLMMMDVLESGFGYAAYSVSYDTGGGTLSVTYVDGLDSSITDVTESVVFAYGISL